MRSVNEELFENTQGAFSCELGGQFDVIVFYFSRELGIKQFTQYFRYPLSGFAIP
jgi:hypothetical protein